MALPTSELAVVQNLDFFLAALVNGDDAPLELVLGLVGLCFLAGVDDGRLLTAGTLTSSIEMVRPDWVA